MADRIGVAALWPRWGHASDVPELLEMLLSYEVLFLGPLAQRMDTLGDFNHQLRHILEVFYSMINCPLQPSLSSMRGSLVQHTQSAPVLKSRYFAFALWLEIQIKLIIHHLSQLRYNMQSCESFGFKSFSRSNNRLPSPIHTMVWNILDAVMLSCEAFWFKSVSRCNNSLPSPSDTMLWNIINCKAWDVFNLRGGDKHLFQMFSSILYYHVLGHVSHSIFQNHGTLL